MESVLLLNASFAPLRTIPMKRAMVLLLQGKADLLEAADGVISSASEDFPRPSVVKLNYFVTVPFQARVALNRRSLMARDGGICQYGCGRKASTIDHVFPRSRGGKHEWTNVLACCPRCNLRKADSTLEEIGWEPLKQPHVPTTNIWLMSNVESRPEWKPYLEMI